jgi:uncharacterized protein YbjT (DUF2867 family)
MDSRRIAVAGATGRVGRHIVSVLTEQGHDVVPIARSAGVNVITGQRLAEALAGAECIIDAATGPSPEEGAATEFFTTAAANLQRSGADAGASKIVLVSIIGTERLRGGYSRAKVAHERAARAGALPVQVVRAAQFHEFVPQLVEWGTQGDVAFVARMRTQLVAARTVAEVVAEVAVNEAANRPTDDPHVEVAGPCEESMVAAAELYVARRRPQLRIEAVSDPDDAAAYESGAVLPGPNAVLAGPTFEQWLDSQLDQ